jgi:hypothetical protein
VYKSSDRASDRPEPIAHCRHLLTGVAAPRENAANARATPARFGSD